MSSGEASADLQACTPSLCYVFPYMLRLSPITAYPIPSLVGYCLDQGCVLRAVLLHSLYLLQVPGTLKAITIFVELLK